MVNKVEEAVNLFHTGYNCAQAVFSAYSSQLGIDKQYALKISSGFGAGMGRMQETCGALTGAYMVAGLILGQGQADDKAARERTYLAVRNITERFIERNHTALCKELLGIDLQTEEGQIQFQANDLFNKVCSKCVQDAATIVKTELNEDLIKSGD